MSIKLKHLVLLIAFLLAVVIVGGVIVVRHGFSARDNPSGMEKIVAQTARSLAMPSSARSMKNPVPNTPDNLNEAMKHWADHCAFCHANNGSGDTEVGKNLYPKAPDMRLADTQKLTDGELYYTIKNGVRLTGMPAWGEAGDTDEDSWKLVHFIRHLSSLSPEEEKEMEQLNPKGPEEKLEEQQEEDFLKGGDVPPQPKHMHH